MHCDPGIRYTQLLQIIPRYPESGPAGGEFDFIVLGFSHGTLAYGESAWRE